MSLATDGQIATVTKLLATDGQIATVVQMGIGAPLLKADLGACKNGGNGAFLATDGLIATVVRKGLGASLLKADLGARKQWGIGARGGSDIKFAYWENSVTMMLTIARYPSYLCIYLFA